MYERGRQSRWDTERDKKGVRKEEEKYELRA